jgi:signal transduction histidine kinase
LNANHLFVLSLGYAQATILFTAGICGLHFTAMTAVTYYPDATIDVPQSVFDPLTLALIISSVAIVVLMLGLVGALVDSHLARRAGEESERLRRHIQELEATKAKLEETSENLSSALVAADAASKAKSEFLAAMSHELRTPLNAVIGFSDMMLEEAFGPIGSPRYREYISDIRTSGTHLLALINDVLDITRLDAGAIEMKEEIFSLDDIVSETLRLVAHQGARSRVELTMDLPAGLPFLRADRRRVRQVLLNLAVNAVKFTPPGGKVAITAQTRPDGLAVMIKDSGIGIAAEHLPRVMERFYQVDSTLGRKFGGAGLGLPLTRQLMELHGGKLELKSTLGVGTVVSVVFPLDRLSDSRQATSAAA